MKSLQQLSSAAAPALSLALTVLACGSPPGDDLVLAQDRNGPITLEDVDRILIGPGAQIRSQGTELDEVFRTVARRIAADRILIEEARLVGADQSQEFLQRQRAILRTAHTEAHLGSRVSAAGVIDDATLREEWDRRRSQFERPERRIVSQVFLRFAEGESRESARSRAEAARQRIVDGENFAQVAQELSDSETRHQGGRLGAVERGRFSRDFDELIFGLDSGELSPVVLTRDGAHFFLVEQVLEERRPGFQEVASLLAQELAQERRRDLLRGTVEELGDTTDARRLQPERLIQTLQSGPANAVVAEVGDQRLSVAQLRQQLQDLQRRLGSRAPRDLALLVLDDWFLRERLFQHLEYQGLPEIDQELLEDATRRELSDFYTRRRLASWLGEQSEQVQDFFEFNQARFARPPRLRLTRLRAVLGDDPVQRMTRLEAAVARLDRGEFDLETLAAQLDAEITEWPLLAPAAISQRSPRALRFVGLLERGQHSPPLQNQQGIELFRVEERIEAVPQPLTAVREQVLEMMIESQGPRLLQDLFDDLLTESGFEIDERALSSAARRLGTGTGVD